MPIINYLTLSKLFVFSDTQLSNQKKWVQHKNKIRIKYNLANLYTSAWQ